ncbi:MAG: response regulator [Vampirovibrionales bacterium]|nr:response regulator [Vampirovibrionales bacterium]
MSNVILLVEDNPSDEALTLRAFKQNNITNDVVVARDGVEALDYLFARNAYAERDINDVPQIVILDLKLPKVDGLEVLKELRANEITAKLPVVILTSSSEERDIISAYDLGTNAYVQKPVDFMDFASAVKHLGMFWLLLNKPCPYCKVPV